MKLGNTVLDDKTQYYQYYNMDFDDKRGYLSVPIPTSQVEQLKSATTFEDDIFPFRFINLVLKRSKNFKDQVMGKQGRIKDDITLLMFEGDVVFKEVTEPIEYCDMLSTEKSEQYRIEAQVLGKCENVFVEYTKENLPPQITKDTL